MWACASPCLSSGARRRGARRLRRHPVRCSLSRSLLLTLGVTAQRSLYRVGVAIRRRRPRRRSPQRLGIRTCHRRWTGPFCGIAMPLQAQSRQLVLLCPYSGPIVQGETARCGCAGLAEGARAIAAATCAGADVPASADNDPRNKPLCYAEKCFDCGKVWAQTRRMPTIHG